MLIPLSNIRIINERIRELVNISYTSVIIFTALDLDSLCTYVILTGLFRLENIYFQTYHVPNYSLFGEKLNEAQDLESVNLYLFINCGGTVDLTEYEFISRVKVILFDVHKPIHHKNIECPSIQVIDDGSSQLQHYPTSEEIAKYEQFEQYDLEENSDDEQEEDNDESPKRRSEKIMIKKKMRKHKQLIGGKINNYYSNNFFSLPSSYSAYRLMRDINKANNDNLWAAIVGLTGMFLEQKISKEQLQGVSGTYRTEVIKFNSQSGKKERGDISCKMGYQFTLMDHWSLYDSIMHSNYMMIKMGLWEDKGINNLYELLTVIGISLSDAKQLFKFMPRDQQAKLENKIFSCAEKFNLLDVAYLSFMRHTDYSSAYMASDFYYMLTAALEHPPKIRLPLEQLSDYRIQCFKEAEQVFGASHLELQTRVKQYQQIVTVIMNEARSLIQREQVMMIEEVGFANIRNDSETRKVFEHPCTLIRLAYLLMGIQKESDKKRRRKKTDKPFIASYMDVQRNMCTVVGVVHESKNPLGKSFEQIYKKLNIDVRHDSFMANIIILPKDSLLDFIKDIGKF